MSAQWNTAGLMARIRTAANAALLTAAEDGANAARDSIGRAPYGTHSQPGEPPNWQTGELHRSIVARKGDDWQANFGSTSKHGVWMEKGVPLIKPIKGQYLPVPINLAAQIMARRVAGGNGMLRTQNLQLIVNKEKHQALLVEMTRNRTKQKKNGAVFVLKRSVTIKPRPWLRPAYDKNKARILGVFEGRFKANMAGAP